MQAIIDFYERHEWIRWILFLPLTVGVCFIFNIALALINYDIAHSFLYVAIFAPAVFGFISPYLIRYLSPRWPRFWGWLLFSLGCLGTLCGIINLVIGIAGDAGYREFIGVTIWTIASFISNKKQDS